MTADAQRVDDADWDDTLYRPAAPAQVPTRLIAVPYYLWNNRGQRHHDGVDTGDRVTGRLEIASSQRRADAGLHLASIADII